jgi:predicted nucleotidyltransferase
MKSKQPSIHLTKAETQAVKRVKTALQVNWPQAKFVLFGSKARGTPDQESDIDLLVMLPCPVTPEIRQQIVHIVFEINLIYESNISVLIVSEEEWQHAHLALLPIHAVVEKEGILL